MRTGEPVTFKWLAGAILGLCLGGALVTGSAYAWFDTKLSAKLDMKEYQSTTEDIKWIRKCMVTKCWDKP